MIIKIHLCMNQPIKSGVNTETKSRDLCINENGLHHPMTGNMKNKDLTFITYSTINEKIIHIIKRRHVKL